MKRLLFIVVVWGAALLPLAAQAQSRGMGFRGGAAPRVSSGFGARGTGFAGRPASFAGRPMGRVAPAGIRTAPTGRIMTSQRRAFIRGQRSFVSRSRFGFRGQHHFRHRFFFNDFDADDFGCFNGFNSFGCVNPFLFGGFGIGYPGDPFYAGYYSQPQPQPVVEEQDNGGRDRELALEVQELSDEIQSMRDEQRSRENRNTSANRSGAQDDGPNALLIFRDGLQLSVRNYAVAGDTIWVLDEHSARKIPISKLDVPATEQANAKNGVEIHLPK